MPPTGPHLSREQFEAQIAQRWASVGVEYHAMDDGHNWPTIDFNQPKRRVVITPDTKLVTDQSSANWDEPKSRTPGKPIEVMETEDGLRVWDGHHRLLAARKAGVSIKADVYADPRPSGRARYPGVRAYR